MQNDRMEFTQDELVYISGVAIHILPAVLAGLSGIESKKWSYLSSRLNDVLVNMLLGGGVSVAAHDSVLPLVALFELIGRLAEWHEEYGDIALSNRLHAAVAELFGKDKNQGFARLDDESV